MKRPVSWAFMAAMLLLAGSQWARLRYMEEQKEQRQQDFARHAAQRERLQNETELMNGRFVENCARQEDAETCRCLLERLGSGGGRTFSGNEELTAYVRRVAEAVWRGSESWPPDSELVAEELLACRRGGDARPEAAEPSIGATQPATGADVESRVKDIVGEQLGLSSQDVTLDAHFIEDLGTDELDLTELVMAIQEEFDLEVSDVDAERIRTVRDLSAYVQAHQGPRSTLEREPQ
jgi:acyl carrier protein